MMWNANLGLSSQTGYKQPPWEWKLLPPATRRLWSLRTKRRETDVCSKKGRCSGGSRGCQRPAASALVVLAPEPSQSPQRFVTLGPATQPSVGPEPPQNIPSICEGLCYFSVHLETKQNKTTKTSGTRIYTELCIIIGAKTNISCTKQQLSIEA